MDLFIGLGFIVYIYAVIYTANMVDTEQWSPTILRLMLYSIAFIIFSMAMTALQMLFYALGSFDEEILSQLSTQMLPQIDVTTALVITISTGFALFISISVIVSQKMRDRIQRLVDVHSVYNPLSAVHTTAIVLGMALLTSTMVLFLLSGGMAGLAENIEVAGVSTVESIVTAFLWVLAAFMGVGYAIRRDLSFSLIRLGLRMPTSQDISVGIGGGVVLWLISVIFSIVWQIISDPTVFNEQTQAVDQFSQAINTLPLALLISVTAAVGEEIFIRGALQPVFGLWITSLFFALLHSQYLFAPSMILIFVVAVGLGLIRRRLSTTSAIIAHFVYNFVPLSLLLVGGIAS